MFHITPYLLALFLLLAACTGGEEQKGDPVPQEELVAVSFNSTIDLVTKGDDDAPKTLEEGVLVNIYVYKQTGTATPTGSPVVSRKYKVVAGGSMELADADISSEETKEDMYLPVGTYAFFALAINEKGKEPPALDGVNAYTGQLENGTDYIYCGVNATLQSTPGVPHAVSLSFHRLCTLLSLSIGCGSGSDKATAADAPTFAFPVTDPSGSKITLGGNPVITPGKLESTKITIASDAGGSVDAGFTASCIVLPIANNQAIPVTITFQSITFGDLVQKNKVYELTIPSTDGGWVSGNQYNYQTNISGNEVTFGDVTVKQWTDGGEGNFPNDGITEDF